MRAYVLKHYGGPEGSLLMDVRHLRQGHAIFWLKYGLRV
jgi:hypothetical protein